MANAFPEGQKSRRLIHSVGLPTKGKEDKLSLTVEQQLGGDCYYKKVYSRKFRNYYNKRVCPSIHGDDDDDSDSDEFTYMEVADENNLYSSCEEPLPDAASSIENQQISYQFQVSTANDSLSAEQLIDWKVALHRALSDRFLGSCQFGKSSTFEVQSLESSLSDEVLGVLTGGCQDTEGICQVVAGEIWAAIFYNLEDTPSQRNLLISDQAVAEKFASFFHDFCTESAFAGEGIIDCKFVGFTNENSDSSIFEGKNDINGRGSSVAAISSQHYKSDDGRRVLFWGSFTLVVASLFLIALVFLIVLYRRRRRTRAQNDKEASLPRKTSLNDDHVLIDDTPNSDVEFEQAKTLGSECEPSKSQDESQQNEHDGQHEVNFPQLSVCFPCIGG